MRLIVGTLIAGVILALATGPDGRSGMADLIAAFFLTLLLQAAGPRSIVEKSVFAAVIGVIAWVGGPHAAVGQSVVRHVLGWTAAGTALAFYQLPKPD